MSTIPNPQAAEQKIDQIRRHIQRLVSEVTQLAEQNLEPTAFYGEFLQRVLSGMAAPAGVIWVRTPQGHLQLQHQINLQHVGLDKTEAGKQAHNELLRQACLQGRGRIVPPHSSAGDGQGAGGPGNPTDFIVLLAPMVVENEVVGLVEVMQDPRHSGEALPGFLQFLERMTVLASGYVRNQQLRRMVGQQQVWTQLEIFARQVHASLNPTEVSYVVANEGRRLIECDRVSVAVREGRKMKIEAISGADVVEKRSSLVQLQKALAEAVAEWGERLVYQGSPDETLPPAVLKALDAYLAESNSKLLVAQPLRDEREKDSKHLPRAVVLMECFEPAIAPDQLLARLEVVARHATPALYNAYEHRRIPLQFLWLPLAHIQEGLGGKTRAIIAGVGGGLLFLFVFMIICPYPLKMEARGQLLPEERRWLYCELDYAKIVEFTGDAETGRQVDEGQTLIKMYSPKLEQDITALQTELVALEAEVESLANRVGAARTEDDKSRIGAELAQKREVLRSRSEKRKAMIERLNLIENEPGHFWIKAPTSGVIMNSGFLENLSGRTVKSSDPLLRIGDKSKAWEIQLRIPQRHIGQIRLAFLGKPEDYELDVDLLVASAPTQTYRGKLNRAKLSPEANIDRENAEETEPVVLASVRIDGPDIDPSYRIPTELLVTGTEVHAKVRCGNRPMVYSLFYGVWEFVYEKVVWFF
ncbi:MAG: efflux RND transporter periplasmic adaptor subunit [Planctomycetia bacterium]|nr:efflux RND transporter periplasmic adaptor subunit [Planctomycetia bacterium]